MILNWEFLGDREVKAELGYRSAPSYRTVFSCFVSVLLFFFRATVRCLGCWLVCVALFQGQTAQYSYIIDVGVLYMIDGQLNGWC